MKKKTEEHKLKATTNKNDELNAAIDRVYQKYGTDLQAFVRDLNKEATMRREDSASRKI